LIYLLNLVYWQWYGWDWYGEVWGEDEIRWLKLVLIGLVRIRVWYEWQWQLGHLCSFGEFNLGFILFCCYRICGFILLNILYQSLFIDN
jgi:hypothetical protein